MTLEIDEDYVAKHLDGIKQLADSNKSSYNTYPQVYANYIKAFSLLGLYVTTVKGKHVIVKSEEL